MTERVQGPAYYFPSIEKKHGRPIGYWLGAGGIQGYLDAVRDIAPAESVTR